MSSPSSSVAGAMTVPRLIRRPAAPGLPELDASQQAVVDRATGSGPVVVLGPPGSGRTTTLLAAAVARVTRDRIPADGLLVLAPTRRAAAALRDRVGDLLPGTVREPLARTPASYAFGLLRRHAVMAGQPAPQLISGAEQDRVLAELLEGHESGAGRPPPWPAHIPEASRRLRGFRDELRDLLMRALEHGVGPEQLADLGERHGRAEWVAAAGVLDEYLDVTALRSPGAYDPAEIVDAAASLLAGDERLRRTERAQWRFVAVDDHHESTAATSRLLDQLVGGGDLLVTGDPDATVQGFRGAQPRALTEVGERHGVPGRPVVRAHLLERPWRQGPELAGAAARVATRITPLGSVRHRWRPAPPGPTAGPVEVHVVRSGTAEAAFVAHRLRSWHLREAVAWDRMAVVVRSAGRAGALRRALATAGVPVTVPAVELPVRDEPAVRPLLLALQWATADPDAADASEACADRSAEIAGELLCSAFGGSDAVGLRRLRQALRAHEIAAGGTDSSDVLLPQVIDRPILLTPLPRRVVGPARQVAAVVAAARAAVRRGGDTETVLWELWAATGLGPRWQRTALAGGPAGARADRDLDAVMVLFDAARRHVERLPHQGPAQFLAHLRAQDVPSDTLAERAPDGGAVTLVTAAGAAGREWDAVVVAGVQDGVWPDLRLRGSLLGAQDLVDVMAGRDLGDPRAARRAVLDDELRAFHVALTRARRHVVVTAVRDDDQRPSVFLDLVDPPGDDPESLAQRDEDGERLTTPVPRPLDLAGLVAELRGVLLEPLPHNGESDATSIARRERAAATLAALAAEGVVGADPADWFGLAPASDDRPRRADGEPVSVSPSAVEGFGRCGLKWVLGQAGARSEQAPAQRLGTLVHQVASDLPAGEVAELTERLQELWPALGLPDGWWSDKTWLKAERMVERFAAYLRDHPRELVAAERPFEVSVTTPTGRQAKVRGQVDRVERDADGKVVVVDLKTGTSQPSRADLPRNAQLGVYQWAAAAGAFEPGAEEEPADETSFGDSVDSVDSVEPVDSAVDVERVGGGELVQLGGLQAGVKRQQQPPLASDADPSWPRELVAGVAEEMAGATFLAQQNDLCRRCDLRRCCPLQPEGAQVVSPTPGEVTS